MQGPLLKATLPLLLATACRAPDGSAGVEPASTGALEPLVVTLVVGGVT